MKTVVIFLFLCAILGVEISNIAARSVKHESDLSTEKKADASSEGDDGSEEKGAFSAHEIACLEELHIAKQLIIDLTGEDIFQEDNENLNKFMECTWKKAELQDEDGKVNYKNLVSLLTKLSMNELKPLIKNNIARAVKICERHPPPKGDSLGQTAVRIQNCVSAEFDELLEEEL